MSNRPACLRQVFAGPGADVTNDDAGTELGSGTETGGVSMTTAGGRLCTATNHSSVGTVGQTSSMLISIIRTRISTTQLHLKLELQTC